ncbi:hypothetical protein FRC09_016071 [Ceratobasidium sp. 395]|nr:hypothetical protein FRC09_016071 [Ceratobasidium sp. 395]
MSTAAKKRVRQYTSTSTKESNPGVVCVAAVRPQKKVKRAPPTQHTSVVESVSPLKTFANNLACALPVPSRVPASDFTFSCSASKSSSEETSPSVEPPESVPPLAAQSKKSGKGQNEMLTDWSLKAIKAQLINLLAHETPSNAVRIVSQTAPFAPNAYAPVTRPSPRIASAYGTGSPSARSTHQAPVTFFIWDMAVDCATWERSKTLFLATQTAYTPSVYGSANILVMLVLVDSSCRLGSILAPDINLLRASATRCSVNFPYWLASLSSPRSATGTLCDGRKYFVQSKPFNAFLQEQLSRKGHKMAKDASCNNHKAADNKWVKFAGAAETGVGSAICARHSMFLSSGTVNFLSGEMFLYADYIFKLLLLRCRSEGVTDVGIHYDIICHYIIKMWERWGEIQCLGGDIKQADFESFIAAIPKFHLAGHTIACFIRFALNHIFGVGQLDAEGGERCWSNLNHASGSTSDRGPGSRIDTLNSVMQQWNWKKIIGMAAYILEKWEEARTMATEQRKAWLEFSGTFDPTDITSWESMSLEPEFKNNQWTSAFALPETEAMSLTSKLQELSEKEDHLSSDAVALHTSGLAAWISTGLNLEVQQAQLRADVAVLGAKPKAKPLKAIDARRSQLLQDLSQFQQDADIYFRHERHQLRSSESSTDGQPENHVLGLPSDCQVISMPSNTEQAAIQVERDLRRILCLKTLQTVRSLSVQRLHIQTSHQKHTSGVVSIARASAMQYRIQAQIQNAQTQYNMHRESLLELGSLPADDAAFKPLTADDLKSLLTDVGKLRPLGDGRMKLPCYRIPSAALRRVHRGDECGFECLRALCTLSAFFCVFLARSNAFYASLLRFYCAQPPLVAHIFLLHFPARTHA